MLSIIGIVLSIITLSLSSVAIDSSDKNDDVKATSFHTRNFAGVCIALSILTLGASGASIRLPDDYPLAAMIASICVMVVSSIGNAALLRELEGNI